MADNFEALPAGYEEFFNSGGETLPPGETHAEAPVAEVVAPTETVAEQTPPAVPTEGAVVETTAPVIAPVPDPALERFRTEADAHQRALEKRLSGMQAEIVRLTNPPKEEVAPDPQLDPLGHLNHQIQQANKQLSAMQAQKLEEAKVAAQQEQANRFMSAVNSQVQDFMKTHADYQEAYKHVVAMRTQDFTDMGMTTEQAREAMGQEEMRITAQAFQANKNPAEMLYGMAQRYGYKPAAAPVVPATVENKLDTIRKGMEASKGAERGTPSVEPTLESLKGASDRDINRMVENNWEQMFGKSKDIF